MCSSVTVCVAEEDGEGVSALRQRLLRVQVPQLAKFIVLQPEYDMMTRRGKFREKCCHAYGIHIRVPEIIWLRV